MPQLKWMLQAKAFLFPPVDVEDYAFESVCTCLFYYILHVKYSPEGASLVPYYAYDFGSS